jgi:putative SOS response-associated peptidase YedK
VCGRYVLVSPVDEIAAYFAAQVGPEARELYRPSHNIAPTRSVLGVSTAAGASDRVIDAYRWGLVPSWAKDPSLGNRLFNARAESVETKPSFRSAFRHRRVVLPADAYFEWAPGPARRREPHVFERADGKTMALAGLWEPWADPRALGGTTTPQRSCTIITTAASLDVADVHERMPVVLDPDSLDAWLDPEATSAAELKDLLRPAPPGILRHHRVDPRVGDVRNDSEMLVAPRRDS